MTSTTPLLLAALQNPSGEAARGVRELVHYEWSRLSQFDEPRHLWLLVAAFTAFALAYVAWFYRREQQALSPLLRWLLPLLRLVALAGAMIFFLGPEKRVDQQEVRESQVVVLVDTSQSMSIEDESHSEQSKLTRARAIKTALADSKFLDDLRRHHHVSLAGFDERLRRVARWQRRVEPQTETTAQADVEESNGWNEAIQPRGAETRLGDALRNVLEQTRQGPLAGVIILSDGGQNSGVDPLPIADEAGERQVPFFTVGIGSTQPRRNLRVQEFTAPSRVYPGDRTMVHGLIHGEGFAGRTVDVELYASELQPAGGNVDRIGREQVTFYGEAEAAAVEFEIEPAEIGRLLLDLRIVAPSDDQYALDNRREVELEVVEAQTRVLLVASGPTRDYRFLRNQLRRDRHAVVDVWLQSALSGISQDADRILDSFPTSKEELYPYDCIVAFDPDWTRLDAQQVDLLESWVAEEAGGLIVVAGPIHTASWVQSPEHIKIRSLYPVEFQRRLTLLDDGQYGSRSPWPIQFSPEGTESRFLWLADTLEESQSLWSRFAGVFGCYAVKGPKPGARVLGRYSDPDAGLSAERPVYMAEHFYGGGRVLYIGSGELWRLRSIDLSYFEVLYTKLIRHVSQGRLLRGSSFGQLLVERDRYRVGEDVVVRAQLSSASREPLMAEGVVARVVDPTGSSENLTLTADLDRPGNFVGQFDVHQEGSYRIDLQVPDSPNEQLTRRVQAVVPNLEFDKTRRNEALLSALATRTGGRYYTSLQTAVSGSKDLQPIAAQIESRAEVVTHSGAPDKEFRERINKLLLIIIRGALCCEWLLRRLMRLA
ncbi:MAG: VWA domain-containing protein [Pirellulales bacterium]|nr:VWA domain-containing protein [Pirellulales bacterium]